MALSSYLDPARQDTGAKRFLGRAGRFSGDDIIDIILEQPATASYICRRLYEAFIGRDVDREFVERLADEFRSGNYEISPVVRMILESDLFSDEGSMAALIKSPIELAAGNVRMLSVESINVRYLLQACYQLNQGLLHPPDVSGWPGQRDWITPSTYVTRNAFSQSFITG